MSSSGKTSRVVLPMKKALSTSVLAATALAPVVSYAQSTSNDARADALFNVAMHLEGAGQVADACPLFAESLRLAPGVGVALHLADCYERIGRTASAWQGFRDAEKLARERNDDKRVGLATARASALEPKLERLTLAVSDGPHVGWELTLDGAPLPLDRWNAALALDPGEHTVVVHSPGQAPRVLHALLDPTNDTVTLHVDEGVTLAAPHVSRAPITAETSDAAGAMVVLPNTSSAPEPAGRSSARMWAEIGLVGLTAVGVAGGSYFMVRRGHFIEEATTNPPDLANQATTAATISFVVSGLALTSAFVLFFTDGQSARNQAGWVFAPVPLERGGGAVVRATF